MFRTLALLADLHLFMNNYTLARQTVQDLVSLQNGCGDADTFILKIRVLVNQQMRELGTASKIETDKVHQEVIDTVY